MPAPLVVAGGIALRRGAVWVGSRVLVPAGRALWTGIKSLATGGKGTMSKLSTAANFLNLLGVAEKTTPTHFEEVDVTVFGSPKATKRDLWKIAIAAAFGKVQRMGFDPATGLLLGKPLLPPPGFIQMEYPLEGNAVRVVLRMETPYLSLLTGRRRIKREFELYTGPADDVRGGAWGFDSVLPGVGAVSGVGAKYPKTGYEDRTLLTPSPVYRDSTGTQKASSSPHPIKDKTSRSSAPVAESVAARLLDPTNTYTEPTYLLYQALSYPCEAYLTPPPQSPPVIQPSPVVTNLITGSPMPLPLQEPSGNPSDDTPLPPDYVPPQQQTLPPQGATTQPPQQPPASTATPVAQATFGSLNGLLNAAETVYTGTGTGAVGSLSAYYLGLGDEFDRQKNLAQAVINFASGISKTPPVTPPLPPVTPSIGGGSSY